MDWKQEGKWAAVLIALFLACFYLPIGWDRFDRSLMESLALLKWYAREHILLCLVPAFFIAGAIGVFVSKDAVMKYIGPCANKPLAYGVAAVSGTLLAVCSCTILPLFAGIWKRGAGLGPACAFLYSGPAINVLAIILTARILGLEIGVARAVGAIVFSVIIGLLMHLFFRKEEAAKAEAQGNVASVEVKRPLWHNAAFFLVMVGVLVFANWGAPNDYQFLTRDGKVIHAAIISAPEGGQTASAAYGVTLLDGDQKGTEVKIAVADLLSKTPMPGTWTSIWQSKWLVTAGFVVLFALILLFWFAVPFWKVLLGSLPAIALVLWLPSTAGVWVLLPFSAGILGLCWILATDKGEGGEWFGASWGFAKQMIPLLLIGVVISGFLLGRPGHEGFIPGIYVQMLVGDSPDVFFSVMKMETGGMQDFIRSVWPIWTNIFASVFGAFMYFATLTEVPILQGLIGAGMGKGPALALLLAGPALSLPSMLVIRNVMGTKKTLVFVSLVIGMATISGIAYGAWF